MIKVQLSLLQKMAAKKMEWFLQQQANLVGKSAVTLALEWIPVEESQTVEGS